MILVILVVLVAMRVAIALRSEGQTLDQNRCAQARGGKVRMVAEVVARACGKGGVRQLNYCRAQSKTGAISRLNLCANVFLVETS